MIVRRPFWVVVSILAVAGIAVFILPSLAANFPPDSLAIPYRLIFLTIALIIVSWAWAFFSTRGLRFKRIARGFRQQLGEVFEERFEIGNRFALARVWLEIRDQSNLPGANGSRVFSWIGRREQRTFTSYTLLTQRGEYNLGPTVLYSGDPIGLFAFQKTFQNPATILVMPYFVELSQFLFPPGLLTGGRALRRRAQETTPQSAGVRDFVSGDPLNRIHWPSTARRDKFMVKEFDEDPQADVWIFLDSDRRVQFVMPEEVEAPKVDKFWLWKKKYKYKLPANTFEYSASIGASVANYFVKQGQAVAFASSGQLYMALAAERGDRQISKILETMAFLKPEGDLPMLGLINAQITNIPRGSVVVIVTSSNEQAIANAAEELSQRKMRPVVILIDQASFGGSAKAEPLALALQKKKVPVAIVRKGDELKAVLENGFLR